MTIRVRALEDFTWKTEPRGDVRWLLRGNVYDFSDFDAVRLVEECKVAPVTLTPGAENHKVPKLEGNDSSSENCFLIQTARATVQKYKEGRDWERRVLRSGKPWPRKPYVRQPWAYEALQSRSDRYSYAKARALSKWQEWTRFYGEKREYPQENPPPGPQPMLKLHDIVEKYDLTFWEYTGVVLAFFYKEHWVKNSNHPRESEAFSADELVEAVSEMGAGKRDPGKVVRKVLIPSDLFRPVYRVDWQHPRNRLDRRGWSLAKTLFDPVFPAGDPTGEVHRATARAIALILAKRGYLAMIAFHPSGGEPHADLIAVPPSVLARYPSKKARKCWDWDRAVVVQIESEPTKATKNLVDTINKSRSFGFITVYPVWRREQWYKIELTLRAKKVKVSPFYDLRTVFPGTEAVIQALPREMFSPLVQNKLEEKELEGYGRHHAYEVALRVLHSDYEMPKIYGGEIRAKNKVTGKYEYVGLATEDAKRVLGVGEDVSDSVVVERARRTAGYVREVWEEWYKRRKRRERKAEAETGRRGGGGSREERLEEKRRREGNRRTLKND